MVFDKLILPNGFVGEGSGAPAFKVKPYIVESEQEEVAEKSAVTPPDASREEPVEAALPIETPEL